MKTSSSPELTS